MSAASTLEVKHANVRYHDACARDYDHKWGIDFGDAARARVVAKLEKALGHSAGRFESALEIGAGTGYFTLNLLRAQTIGKAVATDISPNMLDILEQRAQQLGLTVTTQACDAEHLPFADDSFDLVFGHAVLHHLPDIDAAMREIVRVLRPGGRIAFCGEPSRAGHGLAAIPKRAARLIAPTWRRLIAAAPASSEPDGDRSLERLVDVHTFTGPQMRAICERAGLAQVTLCGEELLANLFGWLNRSLEATARDEEIPWAWRLYAYHGYLALARLDSALFERRLPATLFYNLLVSARLSERCG